MVKTEHTCIIKLYYFQGNFSLRLFPNEPGKIKGFVKWTVLPHALRSYLFEHPNLERFGFLLSNRLLSLVHVKNQPASQPANQQKKTSKLIPPERNQKEMKIFSA